MGSPSQKVAGRAQQVPCPIALSPSNLPERYFPTANGEIPRRRLHHGEAPCPIPACPRCPRAPQANHLPKMAYLHRESFATPPLQYRHSHREILFPRSHDFHRLGEDHDHSHRHHRRRPLGPRPAARLPVRQGQGRRDPRDRLLREAAGLGRHVELHLAHRPGRERRAGARQHVPLPVVERAQGVPGVRRLHLRRALRPADRLLPAPRGAVGLHQGPGGKGRRARLHPLQQRGAPGQL
ncbi:hypothetical protein D3C78_650170 [compost metagenome]